MFGNSAYASFWIYVHSWLETLVITSMYAFACFTEAARTCPDLISFRHDKAAQNSQTETHLPSTTTTWKEERRVWNPTEMADAPSHRAGVPDSERILRFLSVGKRKKKEIIPQAQRLNQTEFMTHSERNCSTWGYNSSCDGRRISD